MRYKLLPYLYTLSYEAHTTGAPIARPLFFTFPNDPKLYDLSTQFLLGSNVMVSPVLQPNKSTVEAVFPAGSWYDMFDLTKVVVAKESRPVVLHAPLHVINVHLYENAIIPMQQGGLISKEARETPFTLIVAFPLGAKEGKCEGRLFLDNDELPEMKVKAGASSYVELYAKVSNGAVKVWSKVQEGAFAVGKGWIVEKVVVLGLEGSSAGALEVEVEVDGRAVADASAVEVSATEHRMAPEEEGKSRNVMVEIRGLELPVGKKFAMTWKMGIKG